MTKVHKTVRKSLNQEPKRAGARMARLVKQAIRVSPQNQCEEKIGWATEALAEVSIARMVARGGRDYEAYRCRYCERWHIGHRPSDDDSDDYGKFDYGQTSTLNPDRLIYVPPFLRHNEIRRRRFAEMEDRGNLVRTNDEMNDRWWEWEDELLRST